MSRRDNVRLMKQVVAIRSAQQARAEAQLAAAAADLRTVQAAQERSLAELTEVHAAWTDAISGSRFDIDLAAGWSTAVLQKVDEVAGRGADIAKADQRRQDRVGDLMIALARTDAAEETARKVRSKLARRDQEAALNALADRYAHRSTAL